MNKQTSFIAFFIILLILVGGGAYIYMNALPTYQASAVTNTMTTTYPDSSVINQTTTPSMAPQTTKGNIVGQKFSDTTIFGNAYQIYPGTQTSDAQQALHGWNMTTQVLADGTTQVNLTPLPPGSADEKSQQFIVKTGDTLYFVETKLGDDQQDGIDTNLADDFGVLVNADGIVK